MSEELQVARNTGSPAPSNIPPTKDETKKWLDELVLQTSPPPIHEKALSLQKRILQKGKSWDNLKPELEALANEIALQQQLLQQQKMPTSVQVAFPSPIIHDPRVDSLIRKLQEMDIAKQMKQEIIQDVENTKERLRSDVYDNLTKITKLKKDVSDRDEIIDDLKKKIQELTKEKEQLEKKIKTLAGEIEELKKTVGDLQYATAQKDMKMETMLEIHATELQKVTEKMQAMEEAHKKQMESSQSRLLVGETLKIMIKAIYSHVHPTFELKKPKYYYNMQEIDQHMARYDTDEERTQALQRWNTLKGNDKTQSHYDSRIKMLLFP